MLLEPLLILISLCGHHATSAHRNTFTDTGMPSYVKCMDPPYRYLAPDTTSSPHIAVRPAGKARNQGIDPMPSDTPSGERRAASAARLAARAPGADKAGVCVRLLPLRRFLSVSAPSADALVARLPP